MSNAAAPIPYGLTTLDAITGTSAGITRDGDAYTALTATASRTFATVKGAACWLARRGYAPTGERLHTGGAVTL